MIFIIEGFAVSTS